MNYSRKKLVDEILQNTLYLPSRQNSKSQMSLEELIRHIENLLK